MLSDPKTVNLCYPICGIVLYQSGIVVKRQSILQGTNTTPTRKDRPIVELTKKSLSRLAFVALNTEVIFSSMITLTYPKSYTLNGREVKGNLNHFLISFKRKFGKRSYLWFLEFQKRGAPHIHIMLSGHPPTQRQRILMARMWVGIVKPNREDKEKMLSVHYHRRTWEQIRFRDGAARYVLKYALKPYQKIVPEAYHDVGRFWGTSRDVTPSPIKEIRASETMVRDFLRHHGHKAERWEVIPKYIYLPREKKA